jgi:hypothetical protein
MERNKLKDNFIRHLSNYSLCIEPYVRNIQERYGTAYHVVEGDEVNLKAYCSSEYQQVLEARTKLEGPKVEAPQEE